MSTIRFCFVILLFLLAVTAWGYADIPAPLRLINAPTAGSLPGRTYMLETQIYDRGGMVNFIRVGITNLLDFGVSYGGSNIIGSSKVKWQSHVGMQFRLRIIEESLKNPAVSLGFDSQGDGPYIAGKELNRFRNKSHGAYCVVSRNYSLLGDLGLHGGINYSFEIDDGDKDPSFWVGLNKSIGKNIEVCCEYDFATNDNENHSIASNHGFLNGAVKWSFGGSFTLEVDVKNFLSSTQRDLSGHFVEKPEPSREIRFSYISRF